MIKKDILFYVLEGFIAILFGFSLFQFGITTKMYWLVISIFLFLITIYATYILYCQSDKKVEKVFLALATPIALLYGFLLAPYRVMDETAHLVKNIDLSQGHFITKKDSDKKAIVYVPFGVNEVDDKLIYNFSSLERAFKQDTDYQHLVRMNPFFGYTVINFPTNYMFSSLGFKIGNTFHMNLYLSMYLAKLFNIIFYLVVGYFIIKLFPFGKLFILVYLLNPMMLQSISSIGADAFTNMVCLFWISYVLFLRYEKKKLDTQDIFILCISMVLLATAKFIYFPLLLLLVLLKKLLDTKSKKRIILISVLCSLIITAICIYIGLGYDNEFQRVISKSNIDTIGQIKNVIHQPWNFLIGIVNSIYHYHQKYLYGFFGRFLGNTDIELMYISYISYIMLFIGSLFMNTKKPKDKFDQIWILVISILLVLCIFGVEYLTWNAVGVRMIKGVQGRYFLPFMNLPILLFTADKIKIKLKDNTRLVVILLCGIHLMNIFVLFRSYM